MIRIAALLLCMMLVQICDAKVLIMTHCFNKPEFIIWQQKTFAKLLQDDYEFVVFDDAPNEEISNEVQSICHQYSVRCIRVPQTIHQFPYYLPRIDGVGGPSAECAETIQYMLDTVGFDYPGIVVVIDSDMFLIRKYSIEKKLKNNHLAATPQLRIDQNGSKIVYLLPNLMFFNMATLPNRRSLNFNLGEINGVRVDSAGYTYFYLINNPKLKWSKLGCVTVPFTVAAVSLNSKIISELKSYSKLYQLMHSMEFDYEFYADYAFMHFRAGSNWYNMDDTTSSKKTRLLRDAIQEIIDSK